MRGPYGDERRFADGHPELSRRALDVYVDGVAAREDDGPRVAAILRDLGAIVDLESVRRLAVVGCGPQPIAIAALQERGYDVVGVEPVASFVEAARAFLGDGAAVVQGSAERMPLEDDSQDAVFLESVLEHVDSPRRSLEEAHRVLRPGGVAFVTTTNRLSLSPAKSEFDVRFFQWLPRLVKESYVFFHLHHRPGLANYTERPAVHWFSFADLCDAGRDAGFGQFYSHLDVREEPPADSPGSRLRAELLRQIQTRPLLRALALTQRGGEIFMLKRAG